MRNWEIRYKLERQGKYLFTTVQARYQHDALKIAKASIPSAIICGNARAI
tara:strand:- start:99 stop:248 length:150 start_codon:yes stop_codon:yes gene_type:complete